MIGNSDAPPDPAGAGTFDEVVARLRLLRVFAGNPPYREIHKRIVQARNTRGIPEHPSMNTVYRCFETGRARLDVEVIVDVVRALVADEAQAARWRQTCLAILARATQASTVSVADALPDDLPTFAGRSTELGLLTRLASADPGTATGLVAVIEGMAGAGKTELAVHAGHMLLRLGRYERVLFVNLRGFHPDPRQLPADPAAVLEGFLRLLSVPGHQIPRDQEGRVSMYREVLRGKRVLVVLDNAVDESQVTPLLPGGTCLTLITSRHTLADIATVPSLQLEVFTADEALDYLRAAVGADRIDIDRTAAARIADALGSLPLALAQTASRIRVHPDWTLADHLDRILNRRASLRLDDAVEASLSVNIQVLYGGCRVPGWCDGVSC